MNFKVINSRLFAIDEGGQYRREFEVYINPSGFATVRHYITKEPIFAGLEIFEVLVNGEEIDDWEALRNVVYNYLCDCGGEVIPPVKEGYFDEFFDPYFD